MSELGFDWGIEGLNKAIQKKDNIVIIDQIRFTSAVVTAVALGFVVEPAVDKARYAEGFSLSPKTILGKKPQRIVLASSNGARITLGAAKARSVVFGSVLNAKAVGKWIDKVDENTTLIAAGEGDTVVLPFVNEKHLKFSKGNKIFAIEDIVAAGAIASFSTMKKSQECEEAEQIYRKSEDSLLEALKDTASHRFNESRGKGEDTLYYGQLNLYDVVPKLHFTNGVPEIRAD